MNRCKKLRLLLFVCLLYGASYAQIKTDLNSAYQSIIEYRLNGNKDSVTQKFIDLLGAARAQKNIEYQAKIYASLARQYIYTDSVKKEMAYADSALMIAQNGSTLALAYGYAAKGAAYYDIGAADIATGFFDKAISILQNGKDDYLLANIYYNYSLLYTRLKNYPKALDMAKKAVVLSQKIRDYDRLTMNYTLVAGTYGVPVGGQPKGYPK